MSLTSSVYNTSESEGYLDVCAVILSGYLNIPVVVYISTTDGTANGLYSHQFTVASNAYLFSFFFPHKI